MTADYYFSELKNGWKVLLFFTGGFAVVSAFYGVFFFEPTYVSNAKVLIQDIDPTTFVSDLGNKRKLETGGGDKNPILTQMEIVKSNDLVNRVYRTIKAERLLGNEIARYSPGAIKAKLREAITLKNPPATDIIYVTVKWEDPQKAYNIAKAYVTEYRNYDIRINNQSIARAKEYIETQLATSQEELRKIREDIRTYRLSHGSVDLTAETNKVVQQITTTEDSIADHQSRIRYNEQKVSDLLTQLALVPGKVPAAIDAVALGQDEQLNALQSTLKEQQKQYAELSVRYPAGTKRMTSLQASINKLNDQIGQESFAATGKPVSMDTRPVIKDSVRTQMLTNLLDSQAELKGLRAQKRSLENTLIGLRGYQSRIPERQLTLNELLEQEANLSGIVSTLNTKLVEARVRESATVSNVNIVENPTIPTASAFPRLIHVFGLMSFAGFLVGVLYLLGRDYLRNKVHTTEDIETLLHTPVFGHLSWLPEKQYAQPVINAQEAENRELEYQRIVTYLKIRAEEKGGNVLGFTSASAQKTRSSIITNIAKVLSDCNYSVLLIDADFRYGKVAQELGVEVNDVPDLNELLVKMPYHRVEDEAQALSTDYLLNKYVLKVTGQKLLYMMYASSRANNPYEIITSRNLPKLIEDLKSRFDFILIDTPPILDISDSVVVSRYMDGLVLLCSINTTRTELETINKLCVDNKVDLIGAIARKMD